MENGVNWAVRDVSRYWSVGCVVLAGFAAPPQGNASRPECRKKTATRADKDLSGNAMSFRINLGQLES